ncbi:hypothetical protein PBCV1_a626aR [Paramecium bursaria Chlorella virus 1]|uniref:Uncharacterized protein n=1 Tax=Paramecium bursaria Chlorella virus 1 TaxID=10506 RepID=F8TU73_PBCV1|nr:hypothetical protein PBCV1_a626aR [Paramecium bursaria Chlorella virus 1]AEI70134.1 hypothetical protein [Paramecium bursaria Chlorella virus 1]
MRPRYSRRPQHPLEMVEHRGRCPGRRDLPCLSVKLDLSVSLTLSAYIIRHIG